MNATERPFRFGIPAEWLMASPHVVLGTSEEMAETLRERRRDFGISYFSVRPRQAMGEFATVIELLS